MTGALITGAPVNYLEIAMSASFPGKSLSNTQTAASTKRASGRTPINQSGREIERGPRMVPSGGAKLPGRGLSNTKTSNPRLKA